MKINDVTDCMYVNNAKISFVANYKLYKIVWSDCCLLGFQYINAQQKNDVHRIGMSLHTNKTIVSKANQE